MTGPGKTGEADRTLRLLLLADPANAHTIRWAGWLAQRGHRVLVAGCRDCRIPDVEVRRVFESPARMYGWPGAMPLLRLRGRLRSLVSELRPHLAHLHQMPVHAGAGWLLGGLDPLVISVWGSDVVWYGPGPEPRRVAFYKRALLRRASAVTASSRWLAERTAPYLGGRSVELVPFGVDPHRFRPASHREERPLILGFLKHLERRYGADLLLESLALVPEARLELAGEGSLESELRRSARRLGVEERVRFRGRIPPAEVPGFLANLDVLVMPSRRESFGVAALEAAAASLPVVATRVGGIPEAVADGETGILVPPEDPEGLAAALRSLLDPERRLALGRAGRRRVEESLSLDACGLRMEDVYHRVLEAGRR